MDFADRVRDLSVQVRNQLSYIQTEEATKNALVMPLISALGYNIFNPTEVTPELHADVGIKKGEKVDYAILRDGKPILLFECKWHGANLDKEHASQLYRYFSVTEARFGVLTNGLQYQFFTDLDAPNKMDAKPFFEFDMLSYRDQDVEELKKFSKASYDLDNILTTASELKYTKAIQRILGQQMIDPSEDFVRFFSSQVYQGRLTQSVREQFTQTTRRAFRQFISDKVNERLQSALSADTQAMSQSQSMEQAEEPEQLTTRVHDTTDLELEAFYTIRAILHSSVNSQRIALRDVQSYCGVLLDDNNRKPLCRLYFNGSRKSIGLFDKERKEERIPIDSVDEIHLYADRLRGTINVYEPATSEG